MKLIKSNVVYLLFIILLFPTCVFAMEEDVTDAVDSSLKDVEVDIISEKEVEIVSEKEVNQDSIEKGEIIPIVQNSTENAQNGVPVIVLRVEENTSTGTIEFVLPHHYTSEFGSNHVPNGEVLLDSIKDYGKTSNKKSYQFKLKDSDNLLGMGSHKEWVLLSNQNDSTLTKNAIAMWLANQMNMEFTPKMIPVEVVMIGSQSGRVSLGSYYLSESIDIGHNRVDIPKLSSNMDSHNADITGGYLLSLYDNHNKNESKSTVFETRSSKTKFVCVNPFYEGDNLTKGQKEQKKYIQDYVNQIDDLIMGNDVIDEETHNQISDLLDLTSTADFWLLQEFMINRDGYSSFSNYLYKKAGEKLYWGPIWGFDTSFYEIDSNQLEGFNHLKNAWLDKLRSSDPYFVSLLKERWNLLNEKINTLLASDGVFDQYKLRQKKAWDVNNQLWNGGSSESSNYDTVIENLRLMIRNRQTWFQQNIDSVGDVNPKEEKPKQKDENGKQTKEKSKQREGKSSVSKKTTKSSKSSSKSGRQAKNTEKGKVEKESRDRTKGKTRRKSNDQSSTHRNNSVNQNHDKKNEVVESNNNHYLPIVGVGIVGIFFLILLFIKKKRSE